MTDTHTHIYMPEFESGGDEAFQRALSAGVGMMVLPNVDIDSLELVRDFHSRHPENTRTAFGLHPTSVDSSWRDMLSRILPCLDEPGCVAVGEVGIDLYWDKSFRREQMEAFAFQIDEAARRGLPVIIHCREALDETLQVVSGFGSGLPRLLFHSFTGSRDDASRILDIIPDAMFGINGVATFKNAKDLHEAIPFIGSGHILLETDSPYLAPVPYRGKRNESAYVVNVCVRVAELLGIDPGEMESVTDKNARAFFNI